MLITLALLLASPAPATVLTDLEAGYDQAAYDACVDSSEEVDCE